MSAHHQHDGPTDDASTRRCPAYKRDSRRTLSNHHTHLQQVARCTHVHISSRR